MCGRVGRKKPRSAEDEGARAKHGYARLLQPLPTPWFIVLRTKQNGGLCLMSLPFGEFM